MSSTEGTTENKVIDEMFQVGLHFGSHKSRRHPSSSRFIFGVKNNALIVDLEQTAAALTDAKDFIREMAKTGKNILFVGNKNEARSVTKEAAERVGAHHVTLRWIGGTFTNFGEIKKRTGRLNEIREQDQKGDLAKYTKRERGLIARELEDLERVFGGIVDMTELPGAMVVVDPSKEEIAVVEALKVNVPVIALASSDCNISNITKPIVGNDGSVESISYVINQLADAFQEGKRLAPPKKEEEGKKPAAKK